MRTFIYFLLSSCAWIALMSNSGCSGSTSSSSSSSTSAPPCPSIDPCTPSVDPLAWVYELTGETPGTGAPDMANFGMRFLDPTWDPKDTADFARIDGAWSMAPYPHKKYEVITRDYSGSYETEEAVIFKCPCDEDLVVMDYTELNSEERTQAGQQNESTEGEGKGEGAGNAIIVIPRLVQLQGDPTQDEIIDIMKESVALFVNPNKDRKRATRIAILDTGLDPVFLQQLQDSNAIVDARQFIDPSKSITDVNDGNGHGTKVTGIIEKTAQGKAQYLIYKTHDDDGVGTTFSVICALKCAIQNNAEIINMSFGAYNYISALDWELNLINHERPKVVMVASQGNDGINTDDNYHIPSDNKHVLSITGMATPILLGFSAPPPGAGPAISSPPPIHWTCSNYSMDKNLIVAAPALLHIIGYGEVARGTSYSSAFACGLIALQDTELRRPKNPLKPGSVFKPNQCNTRSGTEYKFMTIE